MKCSVHDLVTIDRYIKKHNMVITACAYLSLSLIFFFVSDFQSRITTSVSRHIYRISLWTILSGLLCLWWRVISVCPQSPLPRHHPPTLNIVTKSRRKPPKWRHRTFLYMMLTMFVAFITHWAASVSWPVYCGHFRSNFVSVFSTM